MFLLPVALCFFVISPVRPRSPPSPYTTLFRSPAPLGPRSPVIEPSGAVKLTSRTAWISDRKSTRLNSSHLGISYAVFCLQKKKILRSAAGIPVPARGGDGHSVDERRPRRPAQR